MKWGELIQGHMEGTISDKALAEWCLENVRSEQVNYVREKFQECGVRIGEDLRNYLACARTYDKTLFVVNLSHYFHDHVKDWLAYTPTLRWVVREVLEWYEHRPDLHMLLSRCSVPPRIFLKEVNSVPEFTGLYQEITNGHMEALRWKVMSVAANSDRILNLKEALATLERDNTGSGIHFTLITGSERKQQMVNNKILE